MPCEWVRSLDEAFYSPFLAHLFRDTAIRPRAGIARFALPGISIPSFHEPSDACIAGSETAVFVRDAARAEQQEEGVP